MSLALISALLLAPLPQSMASDPFISPPPPVSGRSGAGEDVEERLYLLQRDVVSAHAGGEISSAAAKGLHLRVEGIRRQMVRMGNIVGHRQRVRLRARIDAIRSQLAESRAPDGPGSPG
jgi:hypothetical protein